jgi:periplasmic protein TonB
MSSFLARLDAHLPFDKSERIILAIVIALHALFLIGFQNSMHRTSNDSADDARVMANLVSPESTQQPAVAPAAAPTTPPPPPQPKQEKQNVLDEKSTEVQKKPVEPKKPAPKAPAPKPSKPDIPTPNETNTSETQLPRAAVAPSASGGASGTPIQTDIGKLTVVYQPDADAYYPSFSKRSGEQGAVVVKLIIGESGEVVEVALLRSSSFPRLDRAAEEIGQRYRFAPYLVNGVPSKISTNLLIKFNLKN